MGYCYFPTAPAVVGCSKAAATSYRLVYKISWQLTLKTRKPKNSRYDVSVSSKAYGPDDPCCDCVHFHSLVPSFLDSISNNPDAVMLFLFYIHFQLRISGISSPCLSTYCLCPIVQHYSLSSLGHSEVSASSISRTHASRVSIIARSWANSRVRSASSAIHCT